MKTVSINQRSSVFKHLKSAFLVPCSQIKIKGIKPHPSADGLNPLIGIDPRVEVLNQYPAEKAELVRLTKKLKLIF